LAGTSFQQHPPQGFLPSGVKQEGKFWENPLHIVTQSEEMNPSGEPGISHLSPQIPLKIDAFLFPGKPLPHKDQVALRKLVRTKVEGSQSDLESFPDCNLTYGADQPTWRGNPQLPMEKTAGTAGTEIYDIDAVVKDFAFGWGEAERAMIFERRTGNREKSRVTIEVLDGRAAEAKHVPQVPNAF
jgi:hypothetical protein